MNPTQLVERAIELGHERLPETLQLLHPDAEWIVDQERPALRGHDQIARFVAEELERLGNEVPEAITSSITQHGNVVLVKGQLRIPPTRGRRFVEMQQIAWVYEVEGERIARVTGYRSWAEAGRAAGIEPGTPPTRRFNPWRLLQLVPA